MNDEPLDVEAWTSLDEISFVAEEKSEYNVYRNLGDDLSERLLGFGVSVIVVVRKLPNDVAGRHIGGQLLRAGTSPGAHYEEARGSESRADFVHKLGVALKELKESRYWMKMILASQMVAEGEVKPALKECNELIAILAKSIFTAKRGRSSGIDN